ncbi:hypothetical protein GCM10007862_25090 [Dyella lipolytica]|uniref:DUF4386 domain-containing protein n=1 Tax=Dyella lipolytica TaxID=1867835 RepID=A0ABW8IT33_9GAMM|nr:DUF4386 domain-containing protein [Dyella lipolytica]GLQ47458.1 hypothetical protein GCM10007862_25090 [Dyella lipolytica]
MMSHADSERFPPRRLARIAGILALIGIVTGAFDIGYVRNALIVNGDVAATVHNILAHETLFRFGFSAHLLLLLCNIPGEIIIFILMRRVNVIVAATAMCCGLVGTAIEGLDMLNAYVPLKLAIEGSNLGAFNPEQLQVLSYVSLQLQDAGLLISFVFYGLDELLGGYLIFRSGFLPRLIGILFSLAGLCYFTHGFLSFLAPSLDARLYPYILFPCLPGEGSTALWLAIVGLNVEKWRMWMSEPQGEVFAPFPLA